MTPGIIHCQKAGCQFAARATSESEAVRVCESHMFIEHYPHTEWSPLERLADKLITAAEARS